MSRVRVVTACVLVVLAAAGAASGAGSTPVRLVLTPVGRVPFPYRSFVVDLPREVRPGLAAPEVAENGRSVSGATLSPVGASGLRIGVVLALDASDSMRGKPLEDAVAAARSFIARRTPNEAIGLVTFNGTVTVAQPLTSDGSRLARAFGRTPRLAYGTHIYDALSRSLAILRQGRVAPASIVLLSDGADVGSRASLAAVAQSAAHDHVRIFTVGLKSGAFDGAPLRELSRRTGATYVEAASTAALARIYGALGGRLASEYVLQYTSRVDPGRAVEVSVRLPGIGAGSIGYVAPVPSGLRPFHQSLATRFFLSGLSIVLLALLAAALAGAVCLAVLSRPRRRLADRVDAFVGLKGAGATAPEPERTPRRPARRARGTQSTRMGRLRNAFEIASIGVDPAAFVVGTALVTVLAVVVLAAVAWPLVVLGLLVPLLARGWVEQRLRRVRDDFADQLPETLQLLASALRSGHSLIGALNVVVGSAPEPTRREFRGVLTDDQLGVPLDLALRKVSERMRSRDMQQVGMLGELQRTAGGNAAEVLDAIVATVRERAEVRGLVKTLTAQGRMARWILSAMPVVLGAIMFAGAPDIFKPMLTSAGGQLALVFAAILAVIGSLWIKKIVEIEV